MDWYERTEGPVDAAGVAQVRALLTGHGGQARTERSFLLASLFVALLVASLSLWLPPSLANADPLPPGVYTASLPGGTMWLEIHPDGEVVVSSPPAIDVELAYDDQGRVLDAFLAAGRTVSWEPATAGEAPAIETGAPVEPATSDDEATQAPGNAPTSPPGLPPTTPPGQVDEDAPGRSAIEPGRTTAPGQNKDGQPGRSDEAPGQTGDAPGQSDEAPDQSDDVPGQSDEAAEDGGGTGEESSPGQSSLAPGRSVRGDEG